VLDILTTAAMQHSTATLADSEQSSVELQQFDLAPLALNSITVSNRPIVYWTFFLQMTYRTRSWNLANKSRNTPYVINER
jgi:hypothetical protein